MDVEYSRRVNPIQQKYIGNLAAASETAETLLESLQKGKKEGGGGSDQFFQTSAVNFLAACIYFFVLLRSFANLCNTIICKSCKSKSHNVVTKFPITISPRHKSFGATTLLQSLTYNCQSAWHRLPYRLWAEKARGGPIPSMLFAEISYSKVKYG